MRKLTAAEELLCSLGVTEPKDIDLEAIAYHVNATVRYRPLDGCEARIVGTNTKAIITVKEDSHPRRKRFSIAHELGHWHHHRGKCLVCRAEDFAPRRQVSPEQTADRFAADLLLPSYLFRPLALSQKRLDFPSIRQLADEFDVSITATAIRMVETDLAPLMLICHTKQGRKWFARSRSVPEHWFPQEQLDSESYAFDVQFGTGPEPRMPRKIGADAWFDRGGADRYELQEQTMRVGQGETLTLLTFTDNRMLS